MTDDIGFKIFAVIDSLKASMLEASASVQSFSEKATSHVEEVNKGMKSLKEVAEAYIAVLAFEKLDAFFDKFTQQAVQVERLSVEFGVATDQVQGFQFAMKMGGSEAGQLQQLFSRLSVAMEKAIDNAGAQRKAFNDLGISTQFLRDNSENIPAVMDAFADAIKRTGGGVKVTADLIPLLGRGAAAIIKPLADGSEGLRDMQKALAETGGVFSEFEISQIGDLHKSLVTLKESFNGFGLMLITAFEPAIQAIVDGMTELVSALNGGEEHASAFRIALAAVVVPIDGIIIAVESLKVTVVESFEYIMIYVDKLYYKFKGLWALIKGGPVNGAKAYDDVMAEMEASTKRRTAIMKKELEDLGKTAGKMIEDIGALESGGSKEQYGPKQKSPQGQTTEETEAAKAALAEKIQLEQLDVSTTEQLGKIKLQTKKDELAAEVAAGKISKEQELSGLKELADQEYKIDQDALNAELNINGLTVVQKQKLNDQLLILEAKHNADVQRLHLQAVQARQAELHQYFDTFNTGLKTMLNGVLAGTQTWQQAMSRMFGNILLNFADFLEQKAAKWAENQLMELVIGKGTADAESLGAIAAHAAEAGAAAFASICAIPIVGPGLAPAAASAAYTGAMSFSGAVAAASGGFSIPSGVNPVTQLHQEEMVLPADLSNGIRDMIGGGGAGGGDMHFHVHATDAQSVQRLFMDNGAHIAASFKRQMRNANPNLSIRT